MAYLLAGNQNEGRLGPVEIPTVQGTLVTFAEPLKVTNIDLSNTNAAARTVTIHLVPTGAAIVASQQVIPGMNVAPNDKVILVVNWPVDLGDRLVYVASGVGVNLNGAVQRRHR